MAPPTAASAMAAAIPPWAYPSAVSQIVAKRAVDRNAVAVHSAESHPEQAIERHAGQGIAELSKGHFLSPKACDTLHFLSSSFAISSVCTSSGPSAKRSVRTFAQAPARKVS